MRGGKNGPQRRRRLNYKARFVDGDTTARYRMTGRTINSKTAVRIFTAVRRFSRDCRQSILARCSLEILLNGELKRRYALHVL